MAKCCSVLARLRSNEWLHVLAVQCNAVICRLIPDQLTDLSVSNWTRFRCWRVLIYPYVNKPRQVVEVYLHLPCFPTNHLLLLLVHDQSWLFQQPTHRLFLAADLSTRKKESSVRFLATAGQRLPTRYSGVNRYYLLEALKSLHLQKHLY